jgi:hypothetical protein
MQESKKDLQLAGIQTAEILIESGEDVTARLIEITRQITLLEAEKKTLKEQAINEVLAHGKGGLNLLGCKLSVSNTGDRIQYDKDPIIIERKLLLKTAHSSTGKVFDNDGFLVEKVPVTLGSEVLKISF